MSDYLCGFLVDQNFLTALGFTSDRALISAVVVSDDEVAKAYVVDNPRLTDAEMMMLANDSDLIVRQELAKANRVSPDALRRLRMDKVESVRVCALLNPLTDFLVFRSAVLTDKFSVAFKKLICENYRAASSLEVFEFLWETVKGAPPILIDTLNFAFRDVPDMVDSRIVGFVNAEIIGGNVSNTVRESYAGSNRVASPRVLDEWKNDPCRPVINAIARNSCAWPSTHEYLVDKHKSSGIRISIAMVTEDSDLLNKIYHGTKSEEIRYWVRANPNFTM